MVPEKLFMEQRGSCDVGEGKGVYVRQRDPRARTHRAGVQASRDLLPAPCRVPQLFPGHSCSTLTEHLLCADHGARHGEAAGSNTDKGPRLSELTSGEGGRQIINKEMDVSYDGRW